MNEIKKRPVLAATSIVVAICVLIDVGLHRLVDWAFHFNYFDNGLSLSSLVKSGLFPVAALLGFGVIFAFLALMYSISRSELGGMPLRAALRFFAPIAIIMFLGVIESWVVFDTPFKSELITAFADSAPFIVFGVLLSRIARPETGEAGRQEATRAPWTSMLWVALFYVAGRYFSYAILHITSGYVERAAATFSWTVSAGLGMGAFYWQAGSALFASTPIRKALRVGALTLGTFFLLVQLFYALMFAVSVLDLVIRAVADSVWLVAGICSFEKLFRNESYGSRGHTDGRSTSKMRALGIMATVLGIAVCLSGCPAAGIIPESTYRSSVDTTAPSISSLPDGVYTGEGRVAVPLGSFAAMPYAEAEVTIVNHAYVAVTMTAPKKFPGGLGRFDDLAARVIAAQGTNVDVVSGATFTSKAFLKAIDKAVTR